MNNCKLCAGLPSPIGLDENNDAQEMEKPKSHATIHQQQLQLITGQKSSLEEIMKKCFAPKDASQNLPEAEESDAEFKWKGVNCPISKACFEIYKKNGCKSIMTCWECGKNLKVKEPKFRSSRVREHACTHLDKELFQCTICEYKATNGDTMKSHLVKIHKLSGNSKNYISHASDHQAAIIAIIRHCFGKRPEAEVKQENGVQPAKWKKSRPNARRPISKVCFEVHKKHGCKRSMKCSKCEIELVVTKNGQFRSSKIKNHACVHLEKELFDCRFCEYKSSNQSSMNGHLYGKHKLAMNILNYVDHTSEFEEEIIAKIKSCFGEQSKASDPKSESKSIHRAASFTTPFSTSCRRLLKGKDKTAKITCAECGKYVTAFTNDQRSSKVFALTIHACTHLEKKPFQCKLCEFGASIKPGLARHLKNVHHCDYSSETCNDLSKEMKNEILDLVKRCFGDGHSQSAERTTKDRLKKVYNQLFKHCKRTEKVECFKCHTKVSLQGGQIGILDHARGHIGKPMFKCKLCTHHMAITTDGIKGHLRKIHDVHSQVMTQCQDFTENFQQELCDMMIECFDKKDHIDN